MASKACKYIRMVLEVALGKSTLSLNLSLLRITLPKLLYELPKLLYGLKQRMQKEHLEHWKFYKNVFVKSLCA